MVQLLNLSALKSIETGFRSFKTAQVLVQSIIFYVESFHLSFKVSSANITFFILLLNGANLYLDCQKHSKQNGDFFKIYFLYFIYFYVDTLDSTLLFSF